MDEIVVDFIPAYFSRASYCLIPAHYRAECNGFYRDSFESEQDAIDQLTKYLENVL